MKKRLLIAIYVLGCLTLSYFCLPGARDAGTAPPFPDHFVGEAVATRQDTGRDTQYGDTQQALNAPQTENVDQGGQVETEVIPDRVTDSRSESDGESESLEDQIHSKIELEMGSELDHLLDSQHIPSDALQRLRRSMRAAPSDGSLWVRRS